MKIPERIILDENIDLIEMRKQLKTAKNTICLECGCADPINSYGVCFICGKVPSIKTFLGLKKVIKGWFYWNLSNINK
jgi:hypothetical protein